MVILNTAMGLEDASILKIKQNNMGRRNDNYSNKLLCLQRRIQRYRGSKGREAQMKVIVIMITLI